MIISKIQIIIFAIAFLLIFEVSLIDNDKTQIFITSGKVNAWTELSHAVTIFLFCVRKKDVSRHQERHDSVIIKDDFQFIQPFLKSMFAFFVFVSCKTSQNVNILQLFT